MIYVEMSTFTTKYLFKKNIYIILYIYSVIEYVKFRHIVIYFKIRYYIRKLIIN